MGALDQSVRPDPSRPWMATGPAGRRRSVVLAVTLLVAGLTVHGWGTGQWADKLGDLLYAAFLHCLVVILVPGWAFLRSTVLTVAWCFAVELLQLGPVPAWVERRVPGSALVLGRGFDPLDLVMYVLGALLPLAVLALPRNQVAP